MTAAAPAGPGDARSLLRAAEVALIDERRLLEPRELRALATLDD